MYLFHIDSMLYDLSRPLSNLHFPSDHMYIFLSFQDCLFLQPAVLHHQKSETVQFLPDLLHRQLLHPHCIDTLKCFHMRLQP